MFPTHPFFAPHEGSLFVMGTSVIVPLMTLFESSVADTPMFSVYWHAPSLADFVPMYSAENVFPLTVP